MLENALKGATLFGIGLMVGAGAFIFSTQTTYAKGNQYLGNAGCKCHMSKGTFEGDEYKKVGQRYANLKEKVGHFNAFDRLKTDAEKKDPNCLKCHATAYEGSIKEGKSEHGNFIENVGCEACHGPGDGYVKVKKNYAGKGKDAFNELLKKDPMEARKAQFEAGLKIAGINEPTTVKAQCLKCHWEDAKAENKCPKSEVVFKFDEYFKIDDHRNEDEIDKVIAKMSDSDKSKYKELLSKDEILNSPYKK